jgi:hypothetical protein
MRHLRLGVCPALQLLQDGLEPHCVQGIDLALRAAHEQRWLQLRAVHGQRQLLQPALHLADEGL